MFHSKRGSVLHDKQGTCASICCLEAGGGGNITLYLSWDSLQGKCLGSVCVCVCVRSHDRVTNKTGQQTAIFIPPLINRQGAAPTNMVVQGNRGKTKDWDSLLGASGLQEDQNPTRADQIRHKLKLLALIAAEIQDHTRSALEYTTVNNCREGRQGGTRPENWGYLKSDETKDSSHARFRRSRVSETAACVQYGC